MLWILMLIFGMIYNAINSFICRMRFHTKKDWKCINKYAKFTEYQCMKCETWHREWHEK